MFDPTISILAGIDRRMKYLDGALPLTPQTPTRPEPQMTNEERAQRLQILLPMTIGIPAGKGKKLSTFVKSEATVPTPDEFLL